MPAVWLRGPQIWAPDFASPSIKAKVTLAQKVNQSCGSSYDSSYASPTKHEATKCFCEHASAQPYLSPGTTSAFPVLAPTSRAGKVLLRLPFGYEEMKQERDDAASKEIEEKPVLGL